MTNLRLGVDISELTDLVRHLRETDKKASIKIGRAVRNAVAPIVAEAQRNAPTVHVAKENKLSKSRGDAVSAFGGNMSRAARGANTIAVKPKVTARGGAKGIVLQASTAGSNTRSAALAFEFGRGRGTFRHPLFGNTEHWYNQAARPFLAPARDNNLERISELLSEAVKTTIEGL